MTTSVTTHNPARADIVESGARRGDPAGTPWTSRTWALAGLGAAIACAGTIVTSSMIDVVYRDEFAGNVDGVAEALGDKAPVMFAFHTFTMVGAVLLLVFAAGLVRRMRAVLPETSLAPTLAFAGLAGTAVVSVLGAGLDTEYMVPLIAQPEVVDDPSAAMFNHWIGTIPWLWVLAGLAGLALYVTARQGGVPPWIGRVGLVLGGLTVVIGVSPAEYMSGIPAFLWLATTSIGFLVGDRQHRTALSR
jgi:hypothetical protein